MILFFDYDGPILDISKRYYTAYITSLKFYNSPFLDHRTYWTLKRKKTPDIEILKLSNCSHLLNEYQIKRNHLIEQKKVLKFDIIWPELKQFYKKLFTKHKAILITLRNNRNNTLWQMNKLDIASWFSKIITIPSSSTKKDRWKLKAKAIEKLNINHKILQQSIFIGDTETDILAGKKFNMQTIGVSFGIRENVILKKYNPDLIFDTPVELKKHLGDLLL